MVETRITALPSVAREPLQTSAADTINRRTFLKASAIAGILHGLPFAHAEERRDPPVGKLMITGGGRIPEIIRQRFAELVSPNEELFCIPTAHSDADIKAEHPSFINPWRPYIEKIRIHHTRNRDYANNIEFYGPLAKAKRVWLAGGDQGRLTDAYLGTKVEEALEQVLQNGGVIGGTSAGAAWMTRVMIRYGKAEQGANLLPDSIVDQHFTQKSRRGRLLETVRNHPGLLGIGIDERTALLVQLGIHNRIAEVVGDECVHLCNGSEFHPMYPGDKIDLKTFKLPPEVATAER